MTFELYNSLTLNNTDLVQRYLRNNNTSALLKVRHGHYTDDGES